MLGIYLGRSSTFSSLGAAGALIALLFWVYYTAQIFLFGASFTRIYAEGGKALAEGGGNDAGDRAQKQPQGAPQRARSRELESVDHR